MRSTFLSCLVAQPNATLPSLLPVAFLSHCIYNLALHHLSDQAESFTLGQEASNQQPSASNGSLLGGKANTLPIRPAMICQNLLSYVLSNNQY